MKVLWARPVVDVSGVKHAFRWLTTHRFVMQPGRQTITVYFERKDSMGGHATTQLDVGPGETVFVIATLRGRDAFELEVRRDPPDPLLTNRAI